MSEVRVENLSKRFQAGDETREILTGVSLSVAAGKSLAIMGPSGSGKSTLLNIIGTLDAPTSGKVDVFGTDPFTLKESALAIFRNSTIGFIFQAHHLLPQCSVLENVLIPTLVNGSKPGGESRDARARRLLERVSLSHRLHDRPLRLSGGERQRAAVVRALINGPKLLLADEPTGSLDHASAENIGTLLVELMREENVALIVVTHTDELAKKMNATARLIDGKLSI